MNLRESIKIAFQSIKANTTRTVITASIIAIGLTALIGILTAISAVQHKMTDAFSNMGANSFTIRNRGLGIRIGNGGGSAPKTFPSITYDNAIEFKKSFQFPSQVSISVNVSGASTVKYQTEKTNPNIGIVGIDELGLMAQALEITDGRNFNASDIEKGSNVCIIGQDIYTKLFKSDKALDHIIYAGNFRLKVIGVLKKSGSSMGFTGDRAVYIPLLKAKSVLSASPTFNIMVMSKDNIQQASAISEATSQFRLVRKLKVSQENNFEIIKSDAIAATLMQQLAMFITFGIVVGLITIIGAAIGLMNIMLVSVTERTREIGVRKAIGATPAAIRRQFLIEATVICLLGGIFGIILGIAIGNVISFSMGGTFIIPWMYIIIGLVLCVFVGIISGFYPAKKASKLDPIEALRYE